VQNGTADCSDIFPKDDTYQAVVNTPGRLYLDIKYLRSRYNWDIKDNLRLVALAGAEVLDRESDVDMEQSLNAWDQSFHFLPGTGSQSWSPEVQLQSFGNTHFNWIAGANYFYEKTTTFGYFDNAIGEKSMFDQPDRSTNAYALFAQGTYSYNPKWHSTLGYRFSHETKEDKGGRTLICNPDAEGNDCLAEELGWGPVGPGVNGFDRDLLNQLPADFFANPAVYEEGGTVQLNDIRRSWSHNDFRVGLDYQRNENQLYYGYLATGFKSGGIGDVFRGTLARGLRNDDGSPIEPCTQIQIILGQCSELNPVTTGVTLETDFDEEEVTTLELGFKLRLLDGGLELRGAYFYSLYKDLQYAYVGALAYTEIWDAYRDLNGDEIDIDGDGEIDYDWFGRPAITGYITENVPEVTLQGFELEYDSRPWRGGRIFGYVSWLDSEITDDWNIKWNYDPVSYLNLSFDESLDSEDEVLQVNLKGNEMAVSPPWKVHVTVDHAFFFPQKKISIVPWLTAHWEADSYLTIFNVDKHVDDMDFVILDEDIRYTDDKRQAWSMLHAGVRLYTGNLMAEIYGYNLTNEVVQWWGGAAEQVAKGSFSMPTTYGVRVGYKF
jgi:iron complex outermembrane receptor protein